MRLLDRIYLFRRRLRITVLFRIEHRWNWSTCWHMAGVHQYHMLTILQQLLQDEIERRSFESAVLADLEQLEEVA